MAATKGALTTAALALLAGCSAGCRPLYVARLGIEHLRYVSRARPIEQVAAETSDPALRAKLELVLAVREFARAQGLDVGGSYLKVADTEGLATAYVVTAAYPDRLEPYVWRYPIIGAIPYRGYFDRGSAERYAAKLQRKGLDTYIVEAAGYSTLGWFSDPLPSGALALDEAELASVVLHELVHQTVYVPGHIAFNETLATAVAGRLAERFFAIRGDSSRAAEIARRRSQWLRQSRVLEELAARLTAYFAGARGQPRARILAGRRKIYAAALDQMVEVGLVPAPKTQAERERLLERLDNNAAFLALYRYRKHADRFEAFLDRQPSVAAALSWLEEHACRVEDPFEVLSTE